jgi:hypothetical protein
MFLIKHLLIWLLNCHTVLSAKNLCFSHITVNISPCSTSGLSCCNRGILCSGQVGGQDTAGGFVFWSLILHCKQTPIKVIIKWDWKLLWWQLSSRMWCHAMCCGRCYCSFAGTYCLCLQGRRETKHAPLKCQWISTRMHNIIPQKTATFVTLHIRQTVKNDRQ